MSPTSYQLLYPASSCYIVFDLTIFIPVLRLPQIKKAGAGDRGRTGTIGKDRRILSPVRLPIPPLRHSLGLIKILAPGEGLEPSTLRLTAACSTIELPRNTLFIGLITADNNKDYNLRGASCQPLFRIIFYFFTQNFIELCIRRKVSSA